jgi:hypothetical protein
VNLTAAIVSVALFPVYIALRRVFFDLPLHIDTGFYVSNHTICTRTIRYSRGWNARFAGCSKVLPEYFYSAVYLLHGGEGYKRASRLYLSLYNYGTAILVGLVASWLAGGGSAAYLLGLGLYLLLSSEPQYGIYFENAEVFELPFQVLGAGLLFLGLLRESPFVIGAGIGIWAVESFFVKLSSLVSTVVLAFGAAVLAPRSIGPSAAFVLVASILWGAWALANRTRVDHLIGPLTAHEAFFWKWAGTWRERIWKKLGFAGHIMMQRPVIPGLAFLGAIFGEGPGWFFALYALAIATAYAIQAAQIWYYLIPLLPLLSWLAVFGCFWCLDRGPVGVAFVTGLLGIWLAQHGASVVRRRGSDGLRRLNDHVWRVHGAAATQTAETNLVLEEARTALRREVGAKDLFVFGMCNQAYVLLEASYDTQLVSATEWLDVMAPGWGAELNQQLVSSPPAYLLETESCLSDVRLREDLGLCYEVVARHPGAFRLLRFVGRGRDPSRARLGARLYRPDVISSTADGTEPRDMDRLRLGSGWYPLETFKEETFRWVDNDAEILVERPSGRRRSLSLELEPGPGIGATPFELRVFDELGRLLATVAAFGRETATIEVATSPKSPVLLRLHVEGERRVMPGDPRMLNFRVFRVGWND